MSYSSDEKRREYYKNYYKKNKSIRNIILERDENGRFFNREKIELPSEKIIERYINGESAHSISKEFNVDKTIIYRLLEKNNIKRRNNSNLASERHSNKNPKYNGYMEITGTKWSSIKRCGNSRNLEFSITIEYIWDLFLKQNRKCALSGIELIFAKTVLEHNNGICTASLDRINSTKGYIEGNVQWVHKDVNTMKWDLEQKYFINLCKLIIKNLKENEC